ncbi:hypothetical protein JCM8547_002510 [Rhodosporidiobolus lusitaniae]
MASEILTHTADDSQVATVSPALLSFSPPPASIRTASPSLTLSRTATAHSYPPGTSDAAIERELPALAEPDRSRQAYLFLLGAFSIETVVWGVPSSYGLFLEFYQREGLDGHGKDKDSSLLPLVGTVSAGFIYLLGPPISLLLNPRPRWRLPAIRTGTALCVLALLTSSFAKSPWQLLLTQGLLYSIGGSLAYYSTFYYLNEWFVERKGFANGVCFAGTAAGGLVLPFVLEVLLRKFGASRTLQGLAVSTLLLLGAALPLIKPRLPLPAKHATAEKKQEDPTNPEQDEARSTMGSVAHSTAQADDAESVRSAEEWPSAKKLFKNGGLWVFMVANIAQAFGYFISTLYLPSFGASLGLSTTTSSALLASVNGASVLSRVTLGILSDKHSPHALGFYTMLFASTSVFLIWGLAPTSFAPLLVFSILIGLLAGGWTSLYSAIIKSCVANDPSLTSHLFSLISLTRGLGSLLSAPVSSAFLAHRLPSSSAKLAYGVDEGRWGGLVLFVGACLALAAGCEGALGLGRRKKAQART